MDEVVDAIVKQDIDELRQLLRPGVDLNYVVDGVAPIHWASLVADVELLQILLQSGANPNILDIEYAQNAVHKAADRSVEILELLRSAGAEIDRPDATGMTALMIAAKSGKLDVVRYFVSHGSDVRAVDEAGRSALHWSAIGGNFPDLNAYLIQVGSDPSAVTAYGKSYRELLNALKHG
jgi:uncharacterized protein